METIIRNVSDLAANDRSAAERLVGHDLTSNQQLVIVVNEQVAKNPNSSDTVSEPTSTQNLPDWCNVYQGLSDKEIDDVEKIILNRADLSRPGE